MSGTNPPRTLEPARDGDERCKAMLYDVRCYLVAGHSGPHRCGECDECDAGEAWAAQERDERAADASVTDEGRAAVEKAMALFHAKLRVNAGTASLLDEWEIVLRELPIARCNLARAFLIGALFADIKAGRATVEETRKSMRLAIEEVLRER